MRSTFTIAHEWSWLWSSPRLHHRTIVMPFSVTIDFEISGSLIECKILQSSYPSLSFSIILQQTHLTMNLYAIDTILYIIKVNFEDTPNKIFYFIRVKSGNQVWITLLWTKSKIFSCARAPYSSICISPLSVAAPIEWTAARTQSKMETPFSPVMPPPINGWVAPTYQWLGNFHFFNFKAAGLFLCSNRIKVFRWDKNSSHLPENS